MGKRLKSVGGDGVQTASAAAAAIGVDKSTFSRRMKKMGLSERTRSGKRAQAITGGVRAKVAKARKRRS